MTTPSHHDELAADQFARKLTAHLSADTSALPYVVTERLRAARMQALSARKRASVATLATHAHVATSTTIVSHANGSAVLGNPSHRVDLTPMWLRRFLTALPLVALVGALGFIGADQDNRATLDVADVDAALLTSELPPAVFTDPGFQQYLQLTVSDTP